MVVNKKKKKGMVTGLNHLQNGEPYITMWPTYRKAVDLKHCESQTVEEAANWIVKDGQSKGCILFYRCPLKYNKGFGKS